MISRLRRWLKLRRARRVARSCTFREAVESGTQQLADVDDWVEAWHQGDARGLALHERLGLSWDDYSHWVSDPDSLGELLGDCDGLEIGVES